LREQDLVEHFGVSRTPIREALRRLESDELIQVTPFRGTRVCSFGPEDFQEEYAVRAALEGFAIKLAVPKISDAKINRLKKMANRMDKLLDDGDFVAFLDVNRKFHMTIYEGAGSNRLVSMIESSWDRENLYRLVILSKPAALNIEKVIHQDMLEACKRRDGEWACELVQTSLMKVATLMQEWEKS